MKYYLWTRRGTDKQFCANIWILSPINQRWCKRFQTDITGYDLLQSYMTQWQDESDPSEWSESNLVWVNTLSSECDKIMHECEYEFIEKLEKQLFSQLWESLNFHITLPKHIVCYFEKINICCSETMLLMSSSFLISKIWEVSSL